MDRVVTGGPIPPIGELMRLIDIFVRKWSLDYSADDILRSSISAEVALSIASGLLIDLRTARNPASLVVAEVTKKKLMLHGKGGSNPKLPGSLSQLLMMPMVPETLALYRTLSPLHVLAIVDEMVELWRLNKECDHALKNEVNLADCLKCLQKLVVTGALSQASSPSIAVLDEIEPFRHRSPDWASYQSHHVPGPVDVSVGGRYAPIEPRRNSSNRREDTSSAVSSRYGRNSSGRGDGSGISSGGGGYGSSRSGYHHADGVFGKDDGSLSHQKRLERAVATANINMLSFFDCYNEVKKFLSNHNECVESDFLEKFSVKAVVSAICRHQDNAADALEELRRSLASTSDAETAGGGGCESINNTSNNPDDVCDLSLDQIGKVIDQWCDALHVDPNVCKVIKRDIPVLEAYSITAGQIEELTLETMHAKAEQVHSMSAYVMARLKKYRRFYLGTGTGYASKQERRHDDHRIDSSDGDRRGYRGSSWNGSDRPDVASWSSKNGRGFENTQYGHHEGDRTGRDKPAWDVSSRPYSSGGDWERDMSAKGDYSLGRMQGKPHERYLSAPVGYRADDNTCFSNDKNRRDVGDSRRFGQQSAGPFGDSERYRERSPRGHNARTPLTNPPGFTPNNVMTLNTQARSLPNTGFPVPYTPQGFSSNYSGSFAHQSASSNYGVDNNAVFRLLQDIASGNNAMPVGHSNGTIHTPTSASAYQSGGGQLPQQIHGFNKLQPPAQSVHMPASSSIMNPYASVMSQQSSSYLPAQAIPPNQRNISATSAVVGHNPSLLPQTANNQQASSSNAEADLLSKLRSLLMPQR